MKPLSLTVVPIKHHFPASGSRDLWLLQLLYANAHESFAHPPVWAGCKQKEQHAEQAEHALPIATAAPTETQFGIRRTSTSLIGVLPPCDLGTPNRWPKEQRMPGCAHGTSGQGSSAFHQAPICQLLLRVPPCRSGGTVCRRSRRQSACTRWRDAFHRTSIPRRRCMSTSFSQHARRTVSSDLPQASKRLESGRLNRT